MRYSLRLTVAAAHDLDDLYHVITDEYKSPNTAIDYIEGIIATFTTLQQAGHIFAACTQESIVTKYGHFTQRINYKKMAILYTIVEDTVVVLRIIPGNTIK